MPRPEDLTPAGIYALTLLGTRTALSRAEATETARDHLASPGEVTHGFEELRRHGIVREKRTAGG